MTQLYSISDKGRAKIKKNTRMLIWPQLVKSSPKQVLFSIESSQKKTYGCLKGWVVRGHLAFFPNSKSFFPHRAVVKYFEYVQNLRSSSKCYSKRELERPYFASPTSGWGGGMVSKAI